MLRHTFGTHAALFGVNPWPLETMLYVHVAEAHVRENQGATDESREVSAG